jgi:hypothetical protein
MKVLSVPEAEHSLSAEGVYLLRMPPLGFWTPRSYLRVPRCVQLWTPLASRVSRLSVSERCCSSNCRACQVKPNHHKHAIHLHLQLHLAFAVTIRPLRPPPFQPPPCILPAPSTPSPHHPHLPEHPFEREWRWPWQRGAGRRGRVGLQRRGGGDQGGDGRLVPDCRAQQLGQRPIEQHAHECGLRFALAIAGS